MTVPAVARFAATIPSCKGRTRVPPLEIIPAKTSRFSEIVARCGRPSVYLTLIDPKKDRPLRALAVQQKVMSVHRGRRGEGADYGFVGLMAKGGGQLLVFRKSLRRYIERRIIGINYDLLEESSIVGFKPDKPSAPASRKTSTQDVRAKVRPSADPTPHPDPGEPLTPEPPVTFAQVLRDLMAIRRMLLVRQVASALHLASNLAKRIRQDHPSKPE